MGNGKFDDYYKAREWLVHYLRQDLEGPGEKDEILTDTPTDTYICGVLYPRRLTKEPDSEISHEPEINVSQDQTSTNVLAPELHDEHEESEGDNQDYDDGGVSLANARYPSSLGITFKVDCSSEPNLSVSVSAAKYEPVDDLSRHWRRIEQNVIDHLISLSSTPSTQRFEMSEELFEGLEIRCLARSINAGARIVTISVVNTYKCEFKDRNKFAFFQPKISIRSSHVEDTIFVETDRPLSLQNSDDYDELSADLLYRKTKIFALGHGCSPEWESTEGSSVASEVSTSNIPEFELYLTDSNEQIESGALSMEYLARGAKQPLINELSIFIDDYESWVNCLAEEALSFTDSKFRETSIRHIKNMRSAIQRMRSGVELLQSDHSVLKAFQLANEAMFNARVRDEWIKSGAASGSPDSDEKQSWYPFQLAFFLLCLKGLSEPDHPDRKVLDLLWFPTGGGKTEAYFVVIAFTIMLRRIRFADRGEGTAVLMRYSMRLLTAQQFERAARLICACEELRDREPILGDQPISIGLYVGEKGSPNRHNGPDGTRAALQAIKDGHEPDRGNPKQLSKCPWCDSEFRINKDESDYEILADGPGQAPTLRISCNSDDCRFSPTGLSGRLPIYVVDEDIHLNTPTFIVATVDKFAQLPRFSGIGNLFGVGFNHRPPELIVQDELHLISGPLGTMTGLYETAIDRMCADDEGNRPKIIASTATIRNASAQSLALFGRESFQFPPPALDAVNSYFAKESNRDQRGTRLYLGLFAPGTSPTTLLVRTYAALLQGGKELSSTDINQDIKDAYWTVLGYFNTRRLLGSANIQCRDDIPDRIKFLAKKTGGDSRKPDIQYQLWGGVGSGEMTTILDQLGKRYGDAEAVDILMATNMISVGVDINRLGVEAVMGQPLSTSEYIQATSRVGRQYPGLIVVMFNASKSRDRSHYESFVARHSMLYKHVETSSLTPFSRSARHRALHAVIVALCRMLSPNLRESKHAQRILTAQSDIDVVRNIIKQRVAIVDSEVLQETLDDFDEIISRWSRLSEDVNDLGYFQFNLPKGTGDPWPLLINPGQEDYFIKLRMEGKSLTEEYPFETMTSLRNVDTESSLYIYI